MSAPRLKKVVVNNKQMNKEFDTFQ